jgi:AhpD family alkylhydroperoxidase
MAFHEAAFREGGAVPRKYRELVALAVATAAGCPYCIETHTRGATDAGASREEMTEVSFVAAAVSAGATAAHGLLGLRLRGEIDEHAQPAENHAHA